MVKMKKSLKHRLTARFKDNFLWSKIQLLTGRKLENKKWVFIVGCYNSGTTLLDNILAGHPQISGLPDEGVMLTNQLKRPEDYNWRRMWYQCTDEIKKPNPNSAVIKRHWSHFFDSRKAFFLEKSISNTCRIPFLESEFSPAYFIHIVRNGYAVSEGIHRKAVPMAGNEFYSEGKYPMESCATQWKASLQEIEKIKGNLKNFKEISYEDLCDNPSETIKDILSFLDLPNFSQDYFNSSFTIHEKDSQIKNMNEKSFKSLGAEQIEKINAVASDYLIKYGYNLKQK